MLVYQDLPVANNNFYPSRDGWNIDTCVIHSMAGTWQAANARFNNPTAQVSAHRAICYDGVLRRWVEDEYTAFANGVWDVNLRSVTMECEDMGDSWGVRSEIVYSFAGAQLAEWSQMYPRIKLDRRHVVPGVCDHRDVKATACPAALDTDKIVWIAKQIVGGEPMAGFDPRNNAADRAWLDENYANKQETSGTDDLIKELLNPIATWIFNAPNRPMLSEKGKALLDTLTQTPLEPHVNMKGEPPEGHPANTTRAGIHTPESKSGKEDK